MAAGGEDTDEVAFLSSEASIETFKVQAKFSGISNEVLEWSLKTLRLRNTKVPISRFGTWVFDTLVEKKSVDTVAKNGGPVIAFLWALWRSYPETSAWVESGIDCTFALEVDKGLKKHLLTEIASGKMKDKVQSCLAEVLDSNIKLKLIKIVTEKPALLDPMKNSNAHQGALSSSKQKKTQSQATKKVQDSKPSAIEDWDYRRLRGELDKTKGAKEKLKKLTEFAVCSGELRKLDDDVWVFEAIRTSLPKFQASQEDIKTILVNLRKLSKLLHGEGNFIKSTEVLLISAELVKSIQDQDERVAQLNSDLQQLCETLAKVYRVKPACIGASVEIEDELRRGRPDRGSGTAYDQARRAQQHGKRAFKKFNFEEALSCYDAAIKLEPLEMLYHLDKAEVYLAEGMLEKCKDECYKAEKLKGSKKNMARVHDLLGEADLRAYRPIEATEQFRKAVLLYNTVDVSDKINRLNSLSRPRCRPPC